MNLPTEPRPLHVSPGGARSLWQEHRVYADRIELDTPFGTFTVPLEHVEDVRVEGSDLKALLRGDPRGLYPALKIDWANFTEHVVLDKRGRIRRVLFTPADPEAFRRAVADALAARREAREG